jgi:hypothetical protein
MDRRTLLQAIMTFPFAAAATAKATAANQVPIFDGARVRPIVFGRCLNVSVESFDEPGGTIRLGARPDGQVTIDAEGGGLVSRPTHSGELCGSARHSEWARELEAQGLLVAASGG